MSYDPLQINTATVRRAVAALLHAAHSCSSRCDSLSASVRNSSQFRSSTASSYLLSCRRATSSNAV